MLKIAIKPSINLDRVFLLIRAIDAIVEMSDSESCQA